MELMKALLAWSVVLGIGFVATLFIIAVALTILDIYKEKNETD